MVSKTTKVKYLLICGRFSALVLSVPCVDCRTWFSLHPILAVTPQTTSLPSEMEEVGARACAYQNSWVAEVT